MSDENITSESPEEDVNQIDVDSIMESLDDDEKEIKDDPTAAANREKLKKAYGTPEIKDERYKPREFDPDFMKLYMEEPFLGGISLEITKVPDTRFPTAYMGIRPNGRSYELIMGFNPKFFRAMTSEHRRGVIKHELYHLIFQHIFLRAIGDKSYSLLWNWATDLSINSIIGKDNLPKMVLFPGVRPLDPSTKKCPHCQTINEKIQPSKEDKWQCKSCDKIHTYDPFDGEPAQTPYAEAVENFEPGLASDYYFEELRKIQEEQGDSDLQMAIGSGIGTMDSHDMWEQLPSDVQDQIRDKVHDLVERGVKRADRDNSWGNIPAEIQERIRKMVSRQIDWRSIVRNFVGRTRSTQRFSTVRKINKKMPYIHPGVRRPLVANFACFIDQSGSMSDEDIALLFGELEGLAKETEIDIYHFDTSIDLDSHFVWKKGREFPHLKRTRCGGTDFSCVADHCNSREHRGKWAGIIILTDGYAAVMPQILGAKTMWVITETGTMEAVRPGDLAVQMSKDKQFKPY